jgi:Zn-dependent protease
MNTTIASAALWVLPLLLAVVCHEVAHGFIANRLGDDTAERMGRLTLNPIPHIDPVGTILLPGLLLMTHAPFLFGYAKPVPISYQNLRNPIRDMVYVAAAGPGTNLILALASAILLGIVGRMVSVDPFHPGMIPADGVAVAAPIVIMLQRSVIINVVLAVFNLLPIPPLDGGRVAVGLLPRDMAYALARVEPFGFLIIIVLLMSGALSVIIGPIISQILGILSLFI